MEELFEIESFIADETPEQLFDEVEKTEEDQKPDPDIKEDDVEEVEEIEKVEESPEVEEVETEEEDQQVDLTSTKTFYNVAKDFLPLEENDNPDEEFLRSQFESMPEKFFMEYVENQPEWFKDLLIYQNNMQEKDPAKLQEFFNKYISEPVAEVDITTEEGARKFLKQSDAMKKLYDTEDDMDEALDVLADKGKLFEKAKQLDSFVQKQRKAEKEAELKRAEEAKAQKLQQEKEFATNLKKVVNEFDWKEEQKQKALREINSQNISNKWQSIHTNPKYLAQFGNLLSYFDPENGFDKLYEVLENKKKSNSAKTTKTTIEKDSLGKIFKSSTPKSVAKQSEDIDFFVS